jgi:two-component system chemotaxis response regulator CheB
MTDPRSPTAGAKRPIRVLIVEDSATVLTFLTHILGSDPNIEVAGTASDGTEALDAVIRTKPDVVTMDIHMPQMNGFDATRQIMETHPTPIIIVSGSTATQEVATTFRALDAGAVAMVPRPRGPDHPDHETTARELVQTVKLMSEVRVVKRWPRHRTEARIPVPPKVRNDTAAGKIQIVAIGASTGGPVALQTILSGLEKDFPAPVLIVQHMAPGFIQGFVDWLAQSCNLAVRIAGHGDSLLRATAYVAPDGVHLGVQAGRIMLSKDAPENGLRPSASYLFRSVANVYGGRALGVLLTGMGKDGAAELKLMKDQGATTVAQDRESSIVYGMPGEAVKLDAASYVLPVDKIAAALQSLIRGNMSQQPA